MSWWTFVQRVAGSASAREISRRTGIGQTSVNRWQHSKPKPESVLTFAETYGIPPLEALIEAEIVPKDAVQFTERAVDPATLNPDAIVSEINRLTAELRRRIAN